MSDYTLEWISANMTRNYPLSDDASGISSTGLMLSSALLVDLFIYAPPSADATFSENFFISSIKAAGDVLAIEISYKYGQGANDSFVVARALNVPTDITVGTELATKTIALTAATDVLKAFEDSQTMSAYAVLYKLYGSIVIGESVGYTQGTQLLDYAGGKVNPICIRSGLAGVQSIKVGQVVLDGAVVLKPGSGILLSVSQVDGVSTISIAVDPQVVASGVTSVQEAAAAIMAQFGNPITKINTQAPDGSGNISILGLDCVEITQGASSVSISNTCAKPCCDPTSTADLSTSVAQLDQRHSMLLTYFTSISNAINLMASRLSAVIASR